MPLTPALLDGQLWQKRISLGVIIHIFFLNKDNINSLLLLLKSIFFSLINTHSKRNNTQSYIV